MCSTKSMLTVNGSFPGPTIVAPSWFKGDVMALITNSIQTGSNPPRSDGFTINGEPGDLYECSNETIHRLPVLYGKTYLLRIVNAVMNDEQFFGIANHRLTVVGQDAAYLKPANQNLSHYYMATTPYSDSGRFTNNTPAGTAIVQYEGEYSPASPPLFPPLPAYNDMNAALNFTKSIKSLASKEHPINVPQYFDQRIYIAVSINQLACPNKSCDTGNGDRIAASMNNVSFVVPQIDILQAYYRGLPDVFDRDFPSEPPNFFNFTGDLTNVSMYTAQGTKARMINYGDVVEIVYQGTNFAGPESHPIHLHGFSFFLVGTGSGNFNNVTDPLSYNLVDPPELNTINLPKNGWAAIRFVADNPGLIELRIHE
ncbi:hypothetical protein Patl1_07924 [Pistacia atlantica]|uniref:Uncharacterized protein n=1 Tax=Pistacia atlantica TaxID=434234 RepID=A0ACC1AEN1_9ROSI|nr:hypothetical protein Patl1_07924 [Pistacia atlantica]